MGSVPELEQVAEAGVESAFVEALNMPLPVADSFNSAPSGSQTSDSGWEGVTMDSEMMEAIQGMIGDSEVSSQVSSDALRIQALERELAQVRLERAHLISLLGQRSRKANPYSADRVLAQAKMLNYHDNKDREDIRLAIVQKLSEAFADYPKIRPYREVVGKDGKTKYVVAWELVKEATDIVWGELEEAKKEAYKEDALEVLKERVAKRAAKKAAKVGA